MNPFNNNPETFDPLKDIADFHEKFGLHQYQAKLKVGEDHGQISKEEWELRHARLEEEIFEYLEAADKGDDEETLDALVDIVYIALGTCYRRGWDFAEAWKRVQRANMDKERGQKHNSKYGSSYDIVKPKGWTGPDHSDLV